MRRVTSINIPAICLLWLHTSVESVGDLRGGVGGLRSGNLARGENLRLRGGALHGASLTRWQHADMTITEVRFVVCARGYILCVILRFLCSSLALSPYLPAYLPASPLPPFVPLCLSLSLSCKLSNTQACVSPQSRPFFLCNFTCSSTWIKSIAFLKKDLQFHFQHAQKALSTSEFYNTFFATFFFEVWLVWNSSLALHRSSQLVRIVWDNLQWLYMKGTAKTTGAREFYTGRGSWYSSSTSVEKPCARTRGLFSIHMNNTKKASTHKN